MNTCCFKDTSRYYAYLINTTKKNNRRGSYFSGSTGLNSQKPRPSSCPASPVNFTWDQGSYPPGNEETYRGRVFPKIGVPQNGWFIMENPIEMDDLGVPHGTTIFGNIHRTRQTGKPENDRLKL